MDEEPQAAKTVTTIMCPECGQVIEVADPSALIRALHLVNACPATSQVVGVRE